MLSTFTSIVSVALKLGGHLCRFSRVFSNVVKNVILDILGLRFMLTMFKTFFAFVRDIQHLFGNETDSGNIDYWKIYE